MQKDNAGKKGPIDLYIKGIVITFALLFLIVAAYLVYFTAKKAPALINSPYNGRLDKLNESYTRGDILSADGEKLAYSLVDEKGNETRIYPFASTFAHVVGYTTVGETGLESTAGFYLLNSHVPVLDQVMTELTEDKKTIGDSVVTTLDSSLQSLIHDAMGDYRGACVVMDPKTGDVLAMVSKPDYDPNTIKEDYSSITGDSSNSNLLNRATKGLYSPGSTFKLVTALAYLTENEDSWQDFSYDCKGSISIKNSKVRCSHGNSHGKVDMAKALADSCNGAFITMGMSLEPETWTEITKKLFFNQSVTTDFTLARSSFSLAEDAESWQIMQTAFGQGDTLVTPMENAMIVSAIANEGEMMKPRLISKIIAADGNEVETMEPESLGSVMTKEQSDILSDMMVGVVNEGTAVVLSSSDYQAAAKTGSAQTDSEKETNAWLVAYAPAEDPQIVVSIVLEEAGSGSEAAGPIVKKIFDACLAE